jgi:pimeloyl-ACP methyl ester carboxylesterase
MRELAKPNPVPAAQTIRSAPPKPVTKEALDQFQSNLKNNPPKIGATFSKLPESIQAMRLWFLSQPPRAGGGGMDFLAEELRDIYNSRATSPYQLGNLPVLILLPKKYGNPPRGIDADEWKRFNEEKQRQKIDFTNLSHNSKLIFAENSGHHIQLDEPQVVIDAVRLIVETSRQHKSLDGKKL